MLLQSLLLPELANSQQTLRLLLCLRVRNRYLSVYRRTLVGVGCGVPAEVVWGTAVDSREQLSALPRQDRTRGIQRDD